jgi:glycine cleavage system H protein
MSNVKYTKDHEWISINGDEATVGITNFAQEQLGDVVFVEVPESGKSVGKGDEAAVVESVKAASEVYAPVSGEVISGNDALAEAPDLVNQDPENTGWFFKLKLSDASELDDLMDQEAYLAYVAELS